MPQSSDREETIFQAALDLPVEQRTAYVESACGSDTELRKRVGSLLDAYESLRRTKGANEGFLESPPSAITVLQSAASRISVESLGDHIGPYKLLQKIGEGGSGVVYMAEQEEPIRRKVALKILKLGMDTKAVVARFDAERQALAMMDHPNIAKVFDAGATDTGRPYFVMELVRGVKITEFCDENKLTTEERLRLFIQVCHAVQHAHQKGVIHRDLKPSNILVTLHDGVPVPRIIDFGIAKAIQGRLTDQTYFTAFEQFIGTPAYMSPEQAEMSGLDIDTRSDIYSLGVLLYELLTGRPPFDPETLATAGLDEIRRTIREQEPSRPSVCLSTLMGEDLTTTAQRHRTEGVKLIHRVRGDLDWIAMKCLEKDRSRRYATANGLAADLQRHLNNEPVTARAPSAGYRLQKLIQRNKLAVGSATAIVTALLIGILISAREAIHATQAEREQTRLRQQAEEQMRKAQTEARKSGEVAQFLTDMLQGVGPQVALGRDTTILREILDKTESRLETSLKNEPEVEAELRRTLGNLYIRLGDYEKAETFLRKSVAIQRGLSNKDAGVALTLTELSGALKVQPSKVAEAEAVAREALAIQMKASSPDSFNVSFALMGLGLVLKVENKWPEAEALFREAVAVRTKLGGPDSVNVANALAELASCLNAQGKSSEAESELRRALAIHRKHFGAQHPTVGYTLQKLGQTLFDEGKLGEAEDVLKEAVNMEQVLVGDNSRHGAGLSLLLAQVLAREHKAAEAETRVREAAKYWWKYPEQKEAWDTRTRLGNLLIEQKRFEEAESMLLESYNGIQQHGAVWPAGAQRKQLELAIRSLVLLYTGWGKPEKADEWNEKLRELPQQATR